MYRSLIHYLIFLVVGFIIPRLAVADIPLPSSPQFSCDLESHQSPRLYRTATYKLLSFKKVTITTKAKIAALQAKLRRGDKMKLKKVRALIRQKRVLVRDIRLCRRGQLKTQDGTGSTPNPTPSPPDQNRGGTPQPTPSLTPWPTPSATTTPASVATSRTSSGGPQIPPATATPTATPTTPPANLIQVGPNRAIHTLAAAIAVASPNHIIELDAGTYQGTAALAVVNKDGLTIRGVGGRAIFDPQGLNTQGKGTWVVQANNTVVENVEMLGATVHDNNGAAIRFEGQNLTVLNSYFHHNQNGLLSSISHSGTIVIAFSEFAHNGYGDGYTHNIYINAADAFIFMHNYSHHARVGHLVKSRATTNYILYNRLMDEAAGTGSYELDLPNGGDSIVIGNLIQQSSTTENPSIIAYGEEGISTNGSNLYLINNTIVNDRQSGTFVWNPQANGFVYARNNLFVGPGTQFIGNGDFSNNLQTNSPQFLDRSNFDYRLTANSPGINMGVDPGGTLAPIYQYRRDADRELRPVHGALDMGAYEF